MKKKKRGVRGRIGERESEAKDTWGSSVLLSLPFH